MDKYKICPVCGHHNSPNLFECIECETDLTSVRAVDEQTENAAVSTPTSKNQMVRICDCGTHNPAAARKCSECGEDISDITPIMEESSEKTHFTLTSLDGKYAFEFTECETIVGREQAMKEYLSEKSYVSRTHAKFTITDDSMLVQNLSQTNHTFVNNKKIGSDPFRLNDGDEIGLGGCLINGSRQDSAAYFIVRIGLCT